MTVTLPVRVRRDAGPDPRWEVEAMIGGTLSPLRAFGVPDEAAARQGVQDLAMDALTRVATGTPILVVGGSADYASSVHIITPSVGGHVVYVARAGKRACYWDDGDRDTENMLRRVLQHVGGDPLVVRF